MDSQCQPLGPGHRAWQTVRNAEVHPRDPVGSPVEVAAPQRFRALAGSREGAVIVRVLRARVRAGRIGAFTSVFRHQVELLRDQPGLSHVRLARRLQPDGSQEALLVEEWADPDSLYTWVGPDLTEPRLVPGARELIDELVVAHYEALEEALDVEETMGQLRELSA